MAASPEASAAFVAAVADAEIPAGLYVLDAIAVAVGPALHFVVDLLGDLSILVAAQVGLVDSPICFATSATAQSSAGAVDEQSAARSHPPQVDAQLAVI